MKIPPEMIVINPFFCFFLFSVFKFFMVFSLDSTKYLTLNSNLNSKKFGETKFT